MNPYFHITTVLTLEIISVSEGLYYINGFYDNMPKLKEGKYQKKTVKIEVWELENIFKNASSIESCAQDLWNYSVNKELTEQKNDLLDRILKSHVK